MGKKKDNSFRVLTGLIILSMTFVLISLLIPVMSDYLKEPAEEIIVDIDEVPTNPYDFKSVPLISSTTTIEKSPDTTLVLSEDAPPTTIANVDDVEYPEFERIPECTVGWNPDGCRADIEKGGWEAGVYCNNGEFGVHCQEVYIKRK